MIAGIMRTAGRILVAAILVPVAACTTSVAGSALPVPPPMERLAGVTELHGELSLHRVVKVDSSQGVPPGITSTIDSAGFVVAFEAVPLLEVSRVESIAAGWQIPTWKLIELRLSFADRNQLAAWIEAHQGEEVAAVIENLTMAPMVKFRGDTIQLSILDTSGEGDEIVNALVG